MQNISRRQQWEVSSTHVGLGNWKSVIVEPILTVINPPNLIGATMIAGVPKRT